MLGRRIHTDGSVFWGPGTFASVFLAKGIRNGDFWHSSDGWNCKTPNGIICSLEKYTVAENFDTSITVEEQIIIKEGGSEWKGTLKSGTWKEC